MINGCAGRIRVLPAFVAKAPAQIKGAVEVIAKADQAFFNALKAVKFDFKKLSPNMTAGFDTPALKKATTTVTDYLTNVCKIDVSSVPSP